MVSEIDCIGKLLKRVYRGDAWHGPSVRTILSSLSATQALQRTDRSHNAAELVQHMTAWRNFVIQRLMGNTTYELTEAVNWSPTHSLSDTEWQRIQRDLDQSQRRLLVSLDQLEDKKLAEPVDHRSYDYYVLLHGIIQHDLYHIGQIKLLSIRCSAT